MGFVVTPVCGGFGIRVKRAPVRLLMAIYTTFFLCQPNDLPEAFPGWKPPLPAPVRRTVRNPFNGKEMTIETRAPEWPEDAEPYEEEQEYEVVEGEGKYEDFLEARIPNSVRMRPHWCAKNIMKIELGELINAIGLRVEVEPALYCPPSIGASVVRIPSELLAKLLPMDDEGLKLLAKRWAEAMSTPKHTHTPGGLKISDGWKLVDTLEILSPLVKLARQAAAGQGMYLLIEP
jgi:hypothetical protein